MTLEVNLDTLVGPTHAHGGLAYGNIASEKSRLKPSSPKKAALEGLEKMKLIADLDLAQLVLPPHPRPLIRTLEDLGLTIDEAYENEPTLLFQCSSSSAMWAANSATVAPSCDTSDGKVHISIANLAANFHRSLEAPYTLALFKKIFPHFTVHNPLPSAYELFDEGAANQTRFSNGIQLFVYGRSKQSKLLPQKYPARQTLEASKSIARRHKLDLSRVVFAQQNPDVIDLGVFHNDVIATGHEDFFFVHEEAYVDTKKVLSQLKGIDIACISKKELTVEEAVNSYLFNSQIVTSHGRRIMICPVEVQKMARARKVAEGLTSLDEVRYVDINQSMKNGGGPACLRLRLPLTAKELSKVHPSVILTEKLYKEIKNCIERYYPDTFILRDLLDASCRKKIALAYKHMYEILQCSDIFLN